MKKLTATRICDVYLAAMLSLFLLCFGPGGYTRITQAKLICFACLGLSFLLVLSLFCLLRRQRPFHTPGPVQLFVCLYWACSLLSAICSPWPDAAFLGGGRDDGLVTISLYCACFLALSLYAQPDRRLLWVFAAALTVNAAVGLLQVLESNPLGLYPDPLRWSGRNVDYNGAFFGLTGNADLSAAVLCLGFPCLWVSAWKLHMPLLWIPAALCLLALAVTGVSGGLLGAVCGSILILPALITDQRRLRCRAYLGLISLALLLLLAIWAIPGGGLWAEAHAVLHGDLSDELGSGRIYIWRSTLPLVPERLLLGGGPDTLALRLDAAFTRTLEDGTVLRRTIDCAHNEYLNLLVNQGLPALLCYVLALAVSVLRLLQGKTAPLCLACTAAVLCYLIQAFFGISMPANTAIFWTVWGVAEACRGNSDKPGCHNGDGSCPMNRLGE